MAHRAVHILRQGSRRLHSSDMAVDPEDITRFPSVLSPKTFRRRAPSCKDAILWNRVQIFGIVALAGITGIDLPRGIAVLGNPASFLLKDTAFDQLV